jgi:hypothetical protein
MNNKTAFIFLICLFCRGAFACSCHRDSNNFVLDVKSSFNNSIAVVKAIARSVETTQVSFDFVKGVPSQVKGEITTFEVIKSWKGINTKTFRTKIATECCVCGLRFEVSKEYLMYLSFPPSFSDSEPVSHDFYWTSICSRTRSTKKTGDEEDILDTLSK